MTFLEVAETGSIIKAANHLNLTQSAVSMRIKQLEDEINQELFIRSHSGMRLSAAGLRFRPYALRMAQAWRQGRQEAALDDAFEGAVSIAIQATAWERYSYPWISWMRSNAPHYILRIEADWSQGMTRSLSDGFFDVIVTSVPNVVPGMCIEKFADEPLVLLSTIRGLSLFESRKNYIHVDWGPHFNQQFSMASGESFAPALTVGLGELALQVIMRDGGAAYLSRKAVRGLIREGMLHAVVDAPEFNIPLYLMYPENHYDPGMLAIALRGLKEVSSNVDAS
ncbi:LysR family transcriptional regulator [Aminobacter sp. SS-2016]|uniref:LysR family transcriptional regulator n=1 Tax=Aminobacter sp. Y103A TaxID=1870862 RepID=UPI0025740639|nr:LysR family transcriptional regulator [Aminobacter sp. SS-2016]